MSIPTYGPHILKTQVEVITIHCQKCQWKWTPRSDKLPAVCPKCKSKHYDQPRIHQSRKDRADAAGK